MRISSPAFEPNQMIPEVYTCEGQNTNPPLEISDVPQNAESLTLIMDDPDAATDPDGPGKTFTHWMIWNIPPNTRNIDAENITSQAIQGINDSEKVGYTGPCPPNGTHRYFFKLYALNRKLDLTPNVTNQELEREINNSMIVKAELVGLYSKKNGSSK